MCVWFKQDILSLHYFSADIRLGKSEWCRHTPSKAKGSCARKTEQDGVLRHGGIRATFAKERI